MTIRRWLRRREDVTREVVEAVALALGFVEGLKTAGASRSEFEAQAFLEHLANQGFVVRARDGAERVRLKPEPLDKRRVSGAELRSMRTELGLSVARLAIRAGIHHATLAGIESGRTSPQARTRTAILNALAAARLEPAGLR